jgi:hypothetical protein
MLFTENQNALEKNEMDKPSRKKPMFPVNDSLRAYLKHHGREVKMMVSYANLLNYTYSVPLRDKNRKRHALGNSRVRHEGVGVYS